MTRPRPVRPSSHRSTRSARRASATALPTTVWIAPDRRDGAASPVARILAAFPNRTPNAIVLTATQLDRHAPRAAAAAATSPSTPDAEASCGLAARGSALPGSFAFVPAAGGTPAPARAGVGGPRGSCPPSSGAPGHSGDYDVDDTSEVSTAGVEAAAAVPERRDTDPGLSGSGRFDLVIVELGSRLADDRLGLVGAGLLAPGGVLAVLTHTTRAGGRLLDPTGSVVSSAQAADLLYLQHIVLLTETLHPTPAEPTSATAQRTEPTETPRGEYSRGSLIDLLLFLQPSDPDQYDPNPQPHTSAASLPGTTPPASGAVEPSWQAFGSAA